MLICNTELKHVTPQFAICSRNLLVIYKIINKFLTPWLLAALSIFFLNLFFRNFKNILTLENNRSRYHICFHNS